MKKLDKGWDFAFMYKRVKKQLHKGYYGNVIKPDEHYARTDISSTLTLCGACYCIKYRNIQKF